MAMNHPDSTIQERYRDEINRALSQLDDMTVGTSEYQQALNDIERLQKLDNSMVDLEIQESEREVKTFHQQMETSSRERELNIERDKLEASKPTLFDRLVKIGGLLAPLVTVGVMIWWDRREDGGHIPNQYIGPALHSGDKV